MAEQVEIQAKYAGYIDRQQAEIERSRAGEAQVLPDDFDYAGVRGLSAEVREKLLRHRPATIGQEWGPAWGTTWMRVTGQVPPQWHGRTVEAVIDIGFVSFRA